MKELLDLPLGGTAVGTGLNSFKGFDKKTCEFISKKTKIPFQSAENKFAEISANDSVVNISSSLKNSLP